MKSRTDPELLERLEHKAVRVPFGGCWIWMRGVDADGYGKAWRQNRPISAHRLSWLLHGRSLVANMELMHVCDTPACINPHHMEQVTHKHNNDDKIAKGRNRVASGDDHYMRRSPHLRSGERSAQAILTDSDVKAIRSRFADGDGQNSLAAEFNVSRTCISAIVTRRTWKHI